MSKRICAGVVLYNPDLERLKRNLDAILSQIDSIVCVDNGSTNIGCIKEYLVDRNITLIENGSNLGIAKALNQIVKWGWDQGFKWALLLDQDSIPDKTLINKYEPLLNENKVGIICPRIIDINSNEKNNASREKITIINNATDVITSGSCVNIDVALIIGGFDERLFIDYVDTDFQERCLRNEYIIYRINETFILHEVGKMTVHCLGKIKILCSNHSSFRRYYMVRNRLYYQRKYFGYKAYLKEKIRLCFGTIKIIIYEEDKIKKIKATYRGFRDYKYLLV